MNYRLSSNASPAEEKQFLLSESALTELLSVCRYCSSGTSSFITHTRRTLIVTNTVCVNGHLSIWKSQTCHISLPWSNLMTATAIMCSGYNASKALRLFQHMNLQMFQGVHTHVSNHHMSHLLQLTPGTRSRQPSCQRLKEKMWLSVVMPGATHQDILRSMVHTLSWTCRVARF